MAWTKIETELAAVVVDALRDRGWTVYQEVTVGGAVCDIVATSGRVLWAIEAKLGLGLPVLAQARAWHGAATLVSVAVRDGRGSPAREFALEAAGRFGIGVLEVHASDRIDWMLRGTPSRLREVVRPARHLHVCGRMRAALREEQKYYAEAGNARGKRWTPFASTCEALRTVLVRGPMTGAGYRGARPVGGRDDSRRFRSASKPLHSHRAGTVEHAGNAGCPLR